MASPDGARHDPSSTRDRAQRSLRDLAGPDAVLRTDQARAIEALVDDRARALVVQRTGWGKSAVYFLATRLLRDAGSGPALIVSPLLALMRDQLVAARRTGLAAETVNSTNVDDWAAIEARVVAGEVDLLLVSPERLNHPRFRREILDRLLDRIGLLVIDEAHCISDHGHDFRPDYRRLGTVLERLVTARTEDVPVLACTATATDRVVDDVAIQLGSRPDGSQVPVTVLRGPLARDTLELHVVDLPDHERRLAWLASYLRHRAPQGRSGIIYTLTVAEAERVATYLADRGADVVAYTSRLAPDERARVEASLGDNHLDAVVATTALSMGYDKPDLGFVLHLGAPSSPVAYYQAIGRAGRGGATTDVAVLPTPVDERLWDHFDTAGVPTVGEVERIVAALDRQRPTSIPALEVSVDVRRTRLELLLKVLDVEGVVERVEGGFLATGAAYRHDQERYDRLLAGRRREREVMRRYLDPATEACSMELLTRALDDPTSGACGRCGRCTGVPLPVTVEDADVDAAAQHVRGRDLPLPPRRQWPSGLDRVGHERRGNIAKDLQATTGRALAGDDPSGYGAVVARLLTAARDGGPLPDADVDEVVEAATAVLARWDWPARPRTIVTLPSATTGAATRIVADRLGAAGRLPVVHELLTAVDGPPQRTMRNSVHQAANALDTLQLAGPVPEGPVLLVDGISASGWTLTVATALLREAGAGPVLPLVLQATRAG